MSDIGNSGNVQPQLDVREHSLAAGAKRSLSLGFGYSGSTYPAPTVFDNYSGDVAPLAVTLIHPDTGIAYSATSGGGGVASGNVTAYIAAGVTLNAVVNTAAAGLQESYVSTAVTLHAVVNTAAAGLQDCYVSTAATLYAVVNTGSIGLQESYVSTSATWYGVVNTAAPQVTVHLADTQIVRLGDSANPSGIRASIRNAALSVNGLMVLPATSVTHPWDVGISSSVTLYGVVNVPAPQATVNVAGAATLHSVVNVAAPQVTVNIAAQPINVAGNVTSHVAAAVTLYSVVNVPAAQVTVNIAAQPVTVAGNVTSHVAAAVTLYSVVNVADTPSAQVTVDINPSVTGRGQDRTATAFVTKYITVTPTSAVLFSVPGEGFWGVAINASSDNPERLHVGSATVTSAIDQASAGAPLWPGDKLTITARGVTVHGVCPTTTCELGVVYLT